MTHEELLATINEEIKVCQPECTKHDLDNMPWLALRAVVELHKPLPESKNSPFKDFCFGCGQIYPCKTIQAIEKELV